jgi:hypothetical protein
MLIPQPLPNESKQAFKALTVYCELGDKRSYREVARRLSCSMNNIRKFALRWKWTRRMAVMMAEEQERILEAEKQARLEVQREREHMRLDHEKRMLKLAEASWTRLEQFCNLPVVRSRKVEEIKDPKTGHTIAQTVIVEPAGINWSSYARAVAEFDKIVRLVLGMPTGKQELTGPDGQPLMVSGAAPIVKVVLQSDSESAKVDAIQKAYLEAHPEHPQAERILREYRNADEGNGAE